MIDSASRDPIDVAQAVLRAAQAVDERTPKPDVETLAAWSTALEEAAAAGLDVAAGRAAVAVWSRDEQPRGINPGAVLRVWRDTRRAQRPDPLAQARADTRRANIANRLAGDPELPDPGAITVPGPRSEPELAALRAALKAVAPGIPAGPASPAGPGRFA